MNAWKKTPKGLNCVHQKFILCDNKRLIFLGCDIRDIYVCNYPPLVSESTPTPDWTFKDWCVSISPPPPDINDFLTSYIPSSSPICLEQQDDENNKAKTIIHSPTLPFISQYSQPETECDIICRLIRDSKHSIYIENQYLSSNDETFNGVMRAIVDRLHKCKVEGDTAFRVIIVTNAKMKDESAFLHRKVLKFCLSSSLDYLFSSIDEDMWKRQVIVGYLPNVYTHLKLITVDGIHAIVSSSNLCDRSLHTDKSDFELGILFDNDPDVVSSLHRAAWNNLHESPHHISTSKPTSMSISNLFDIYVSNGGGFRLFERSHFNAVKKMLHKHVLHPLNRHYVCI